MKGYVHPSKKEIIFRYKQNMLYLIGIGYRMKRRREDNGKNRI